MSRRSYGSGSLFVRTDSAGVETWYGRWYSGGRQLQRRIGPKRKRGSRDGLTRVQAERELGRRIELEGPAVRSRLTVEALGRRYLVHLEHERYLAAKKEEGLATKTITNQLVLLHGLFGFALKREWIAVNPVAAVDRPRAPSADPDIRFLDLEELEALLREVPGNHFGPTDRALYLTAAMTGLRQGELVALRWEDVDWRAGRIRVRRNYTRQRFGTPKSRRSSRSVPMSERVSAELRRHFERSAFQADEDLVFCHPHTGGPLDSSRMRKRFKVTLSSAGVRQVRFHDLRHTFGTLCASAGVPLRTLQEWLGHRDFTTTLIYADYAPSPHESELVERAFRRRSDDGGSNGQGTS